MFFCWFHSTTQPMTNSAGAPMVRGMNPHERWGARYTSTPDKRSAASRRSKPKVFAQTYRESRSERKYKVHPRYQIKIFIGTSLR